MYCLLFFLKCELRQNQKELWFIFVIIKNMNMDVLAFYIKYCQQLTLPNQVTAIYYDTI